VVLAIATASRTRVLARLDTKAFAGLGWKGALPRVIRVSAVPHGETRVSSSRQPAPCTGAQIAIGFR